MCPFFTTRFDPHRGQLAIPSRSLFSSSPFYITTFRARPHSHHYLGFAETQWKLFNQGQGIKPLLYVYRVLLTGIHLMRTGEVEANLVRLNEVFKLPYVPDLIARKLGGGEHSVLDDADLEFHRGEYVRLRGLLEAAQAASN